MRARCLFGAAFVFAAALCWPALRSDAGPRPLDDRSLAALAEVEQRQAALAEAEKELARRRAELADLEKEIDARLAKLEALRKEVEAKVAYIQGLDVRDREFRNLVKIYSAMSATKLAPILDRLDDPQVAKILRAMKTDAVAKILPKLDQDKAVRVSRLLGLLDAAAASPGKP
ncbi:MAG TPA: MgtE protein [Desulfobacterales bacterium]|nr:MgtE protein [Desulfobacterales bacterium]